MSEPLLHPVTGDSVHGTSSLDLLESESVLSQHRQGRWLAEHQATAVTAFYVFAFLYDFVTFVVITIAVEPKGPHLGRTKTFEGENGLFGWHFVHLTYWGGCTQTIYFACCILDALNRHKPWWRSEFHAHRDRFFTLAFAVGTAICFGFWLVIFPSEGTQRYDKNHPFNGYYMSFAEHGMTSIFIWVELALVYHQYGPRIDALLTFVFTTMYVCWNLLCRFKDGYWAYGVEKQIPVTARYFLFPLVPFIVTGCYFVGEKLTARIWKEKLRPPQ